MFLRITIFILLTIISLFVPHVSSASQFSLHFVEDARSRNAVCNDGSDAAYYVRPGSGSGQNLWVLWLEGGAFCGNNAECDQRQINLPLWMTSNGLPTSFGGLKGFLSNSQSANPDFFNANFVLIHYCSSDAWSGNRAASTGTKNRSFRGLNIFRAVVHDLMDPTIMPPPNLANATQVVLSGSSAGGVGVMIHLDWLASQLKSATVAGLNDAGWGFDFGPYDPKLVPILTRLKQARAFWKAKVDSSCSRAFGKNKVRCYSSDAFLYISTPLFIYISQFDTAALELLGVTLPLDGSEKAYAQNFAAAVRASLDPVPAAFSPRKLIHAILYKKQFGALKVDGLSLRILFGNWFFQRSGPTKVIQ